MTVTSVGRMQTVTAIVMAYAILVILVSPAVPSPLTTTRSKQTVHPPQMIAPAGALLFTAAADIPQGVLWSALEATPLALSGSDRVDFTQARLC